MIKKIVNIILLGVLLIPLACVDKYWPEINNYDNLLVVDGMITNGGDSTIVNLSRSGDVNNEIIDPVTNAKVSISSLLGEEATLGEIQPGKYLLTDSLFNKEIGNSYQLTIVLKNGEVYESKFGELLEPSTIDSVYGEIEYKDINQQGYTPQGLQFYIDNSSPQSDTSFYLWRLWQTYKYSATFTLDYLWEGKFTPVYNPDSLQICWRTKRVSEIFTYSTKFLDDTRLRKYPLVFTNTDTKMLSIRYSLLVEQINISEEDFNYWDALRQQEANQGNLYSYHPVQIRGNIRNINNEDEVVLGNFTVGSISRKRIFVNRPPLTFYFTVCTPDFDGMMFIGGYGPDDWPVYITDVPGQGMAMGTSDVCFDCRLEGGSLSPPDFWVD